MFNNTRWHRFVSAASAPLTRRRIVEDRCVNQTNACGVKYQGWLNGKHPAPQDGIKAMELKFFKSYCGSMHGNVRVRNCGDFYVYQFISMPFWDCEYGICIE